MISYTCISPHPPVIIPEVGGENVKKITATVQAMNIMAKELVATAPETLVFLTPHGNVFADGVSCLTEPKITGNLGNFGRADIKTSRSNDLDLIEEISKQLNDTDINILGIDRKLAGDHNLNPYIDHGILVPLYYLDQAGLPDIPIVAISIGFLSLLDLYTLGNVIKESADRLGKRIAVVASGDMSHRLKDEGPYDYHPDGPVFDNYMKTMLAAGDFQGVLDIPEKLRDTG